MLTFSWFSKNLEGIINSNLNPILLSTIFLIYRCFLISDQKFNEMYLIIVFCIFIQIFAAFFNKKLVVNLKKNYFCVNCCIIINAIISIYLIPFSDFFLGIEFSIICYQNFSAIRNKFIKMGLLSLVMIALIKKDDSLKFDFIYAAYYIFILFLLVFFFHKKKVIISSTKSEINIFDKNRNSTKQMSSIKLKSCILSQKSHSKISIHEKENKFQNLNSYINQGILIIDDLFNLRYVNECVFDYFETTDLELVKNKLLDLEENLDIYESGFNNIPDSALQSLFERTLRKMDSFVSKFDEVSEITEKMNWSQKRSSLPRNRFSFISLNSREDNKINYENWNKKNLNENLTEKIIQKMEKEKPKKVLNYLKRLIKYWQENSIKSNSKSPEHSNIPNDIEQFFMYAILKKQGKTENEDSILLNFALLRNENSKEEILISIRRLSDLEMKYKKTNFSKNKILGSFCHELRTPINGIMNMLDLIRSQIDEVANINYDTPLLENLSTAIISSHLLLNQIDDFIDYFSYCNNLIEINVVQFDVNTFFNEIYRIFSHIAFKKNLNFTIEIDKNIPEKIHNDQTKIRQILFNLLSKKKNF